MKKVILLFVFIASMVEATMAQQNDQAIGVRLGWGAELSYQNQLKKNTRLEIDLGLGGWDHGGFLLTGVHQWIWNIEGDLDWYAGLGPQIGSVWYKTDNVWYQNFGLGIAGQIGLQYNLPIPVQITLDYRPSWFIIPSEEGFGYGNLALGLRYRF